MVICEMGWRTHAPATRNIARLIPAVMTAARLLSAVRQESALVTAAGAFDVHQSSGVEWGWRSVAISMVLRPPGQTLTDADAAVDGIAAHLGGSSVHAGDSLPVGRAEQHWI
jgi:phenylalanyl-tRNA synthetase beta subunit